MGRPAPHTNAVHSRMDTLNSSAQESAERAESSTPRPSQTDLVRQTRRIRAAPDHRVQRVVMQITKSVRRMSCDAFANDFITFRLMPSIITHMPGLRGTTIGHDAVRQRPLISRKSFRALKRSRRNLSEGPIRDISLCPRCPSESRTRRTRKFLTRCEKWARRTPILSRRR